MLKFEQNGNIIELSPICDNGKIGQIVIYGESVYWGEKKDPIKYPLYRYSCPYIFTIVEKHEGYYVLKDTNDNRIKVQSNYGTQFLYDAQEWLNWSCINKSEIVDSFCRRIKEKDGNIKLLKDIIVEQRSRNITEEEAEKLGLN